MKQLALTLTFCLLSVASCYPAFSQTKLEYNYEKFDYTNFRNHVFKSNLNAIKYMNDHSNSNGGAYYKLNDFSYYTHEEFSQKLAYSPNWSFHKSIKQANKLNISDLPDSFDCVIKVLLHLLKIEEQCGSCWAFSTTGDIEELGFYLVIILLLCLNKIW